MTKTSCWTVLGLAAVVAGAAAAEQRVEESRPAAADGIVKIDNAAGSIKVIGWSKAEVAVTGTLGHGAEGLQFTADPHRTRIGVNAWGSRHATHSDLEIHVPAGSRLEIESFSATIAVSEVAGAVRAQAVTGSISVSGGSGEVSLETVSGSIDYTGNSSRLHVEAVTGAVTIKGGSGEVEAGSVNGRLSVSGGTYSRARLETVSGSLRFDGDLGPKAALSAESVSGSIELLLPAGVSADFSLSSFSGTIENELGPPARRPSRFVPQQELSFSTGAGGARVRVETVSGRVALRKR